MAFSRAFHSSSCCWCTISRWGYIIDKPYEFKNNFIVKTIGLFAGNFSPMRSAGEVMNAVAGKNINKITLHEGLSAGLTERSFDFLIVGLLLVMAAIWVEKCGLIFIYYRCFFIFSDCNIDLFCKLERRCRYVDL